jgi:hypothetical protein
MIIIFDLTIFLKLYSYAHTNAVIRHQYYNQKKTDDTATAEPDSPRLPPETSPRAARERAMKQGLVAFDRDIAYYPASVTFKGMLALRHGYSCFLSFLLSFFLSY